MKVILIVGIGVAACSILAPGARAQDPTCKSTSPVQLTCALVQTAKLITSPHPGVNADILGIRVGMTIPEAEAIAAKTYPGKPTETKDQKFVSYRSIIAYSESYFNRVNFRIPDTKNSSNSSDSLTLYFSSPATGNRVIAMYRRINFPDPLSAPLLSAVKASIIKKYGPFSFYHYGEYGWTFSKQSLNHCVSPSNTCFTPDISNAQNDIEEGVDVNVANGVAMAIGAYPANSGPDNTKVNILDISIYDYLDADNSMKLTQQQLENAAMEYYNKTSKSLAAPKL